VSPKRIIITAVAALALVGAGSTQAGSNSEQARMKALIYQTFGTGWKGQTMVCIARRESNLNPRSINSRDRHPTSEGTFRGSYGLFQIGALHAQHSRGAGRQITGGNPYRLLDPRINIAVAARLARNGLGPWGGQC
jgi:hypothetical protein